MGRSILVHAIRVALFVAIVVLIHLKHRTFLAQHRDDGISRISLDQIRPYFPTVASLVPSTEIEDARDVLDEAGMRLGHVLQTSPVGDESIGFSGPTNLLIVCDAQRIIQHVAILSSRDTREHVARVNNDPMFLKSYGGHSWSDVAGQTHVDAVSGATLTSDAIAEAIMRRLGGTQVSLKFTEKITVADVTSLFPAAAFVSVDPGEASVIRVSDVEQHPLGWVLRTSPVADNIVGYQGPTETLLGFNNSGKIIGLSVRKSFDNEPYVGYVKDDAYFRKLFNDKSLADLAGIDTEGEGIGTNRIEGVSGATMTSQAVARGLVVAAQKQVSQDTLSSNSVTGTWWNSVSLNDWGTIGVIIIAIVVGLTSLRGRRWVRWLLPVVVLVYLGFVTGSLLSQAQFVGWSQSGVPHGAVGLVALTLAAFLVPITTKRNVYCSQLCPHGAAQQLIKLTFHPRHSVGSQMRKVLRWLPGGLLIVSLLVAMFHWRLSLVDIEPFDAYVWKIAGWATLTLAVVGLVASCFVPMAYCRHGCPTGLLLDFLRFHSRSDRLGRRDWFALGLFTLAIVLWRVA
jgi:transcriptional regulator of nitric oxide reductase